MKEEKFPNTRKPSHWRVCGEFWNLGRQHNREGKKKKKPEMRRLAATPSREVAQKLKSVSSEQGLNREGRAAYSEWGPGLNTLRKI